MNGIERLEEAQRLFKIEVGSTKISRAFNWNALIDCISTTPV
jgi:hypothetical protein